MKKTTIETLASTNVFEIIGKEWMLITAGNLQKFNMMTASWGGIGWLWNKPVAFIFVRPEVYNFCGTKSGRDFNKTVETGLLPVETEHGSVTFEQARLTIEGRKLFRSEFTPEEFLDKTLLERWYNDKPGGSLHTMYIVEIENVYES